jgi:WD40-like Beta Propeller Repeat
VATSVGAVDPLKAVKKLSATITESNAVLSAQAFTANAANSALTAPVPAAAIAPFAPTAQVTQIRSGVVGFLNQVVTNLLTPFIAPASNTPQPVSPVGWAVLAWVRRNLFNQAPTINYNPVTTVQTGQTVTGYIGTKDAEKDALTYAVTDEPDHGTLTIDQQTGKFTYTPDNINYTAVQTDSFSISVTDGNKVNLLGLFKPRSAETTIGISVKPPTATRVILDVPGIDKPWTPRYSADGKTIYFTGTPTGTTRSELYQINSDGTGTPTWLSCNLSPDITVNLFKPVPTADGSGRILVQLETAKPTAVIYEPAGYNGNATARLVKIVPPPSTSPFSVSELNEPRISPDGQHILFSRIELGQGGYVGAVPAVGDLVRRADGSAYDIVNAKVVALAGEGKNWTPDGKGIICLCGLNEAGNADNVVVDLATGEVTRLNGNLDYDEDMDLSSNEQWMAVGSLRGFDGLTPMSRIQRPAFLPTYIQGPVYYKYAIPTNISNQEWLVAVEDDLKGENGIPLYALDDRWTARSMPSFNATGDAVTFWEYNIDHPEQYRLVVANLKYTTSVGTVQGDVTTPTLSSTFPSLTGYVVKPPPLPAAGATYAGAKGGTATVTEIPDPARPGRTLRTVEYKDYVNEDGLILNGTESTSSTPDLRTVYYLADIKVTGSGGNSRGYLTANATINQTTITGDITSVLDGQKLTLLDDARYQESLAHT